MTGQISETEAAQLNALMDTVVRPAIANTYPEPTILLFRFQRGQRTDEFYCRLSPLMGLAYIRGEIHWLRVDNAQDRDFLVLSLGRSLRAYFLSKGGKWRR